MGHFGQNFTYPNMQLPRIKTNKTLSQQQLKQNQANIIIANNKNSNPKLFKPSITNISRKIANIQAPKKVWYLDLCVSYYLTNNKQLFVDKLCLTYLDFTTAKGQIFT